jgi:chemotaxis protein methyltransferase CheR
VAVLPYTPTLFSILSSLVEEHCGLHYAAQDIELLLDKVALRALERGFESLLDYYYFLRYDAAGKQELDRLVEALVVHETYFFRELGPLRALVETQLEPIIARGGHPRVWCAAASTGEEPITLAMLLAERGLLARVDITASDISERALAHARRGQYGTRSLRAIQPGYGAWLRPVGDRAEVAPELIGTIRWQRINLTAAFPADLGRFDAILCRNALIYFSDETGARVVEKLAAQLAPRGVILVGLSESLLAFGTLLRCEERGGTFFYETVNDKVSS